MIFGVAVALSACAVLQLNPTTPHFENRASFFLRRWSASVALKKRFYASSSNVLTRWFRPTQFLRPEVDNCKSERGRTWARLQGEGRRSETVRCLEQLFTAIDQPNSEQTPKRPATTPIMDFTGQQSVNTRFSNCKCGKTLARWWAGATRSRPKNPVFRCFFRP